MRAEAVEEGIGRVVADQGEGLRRPVGQRPQRHAAPSSRSRMATLPGDRARHHLQPALAVGLDPLGRSRGWRPDSSATRLRRRGGRRPATSFQSGVQTSARKRSIACLVAGEQLPVEVARVPVDQHAAEVEDHLQRSRPRHPPPRAGPSSAKLEQLQHGLKPAGRSDQGCRRCWPPSLHAWASSWLPSQCRVGVSTIAPASARRSKRGRPGPGRPAIPATWRRRSPRRGQFLARAGLAGMKQAPHPGAQVGQVVLPSRRGPPPAAGRGGGAQAVSQGVHGRAGLARGCPAAALGGGRKGIGLGHRRLPGLWRAAGA